LPFDAYVFISYAHESEELSNQVLEFSNSLRSSGVDCEIDQYEEAPPEGWPKWMMRQIQQADFVLVCCTKLFFDRSNDFSGQNDGLGVKWETSLILQQLYTLSTNNTKFVPIVFDAKDRSYIPLPLQPYTYYHVGLEEPKNKLLQRLLGISKSKRPPIGEKKELEIKPEKLEPKERRSMFLSSIIDIDLWNSAQWNGVAVVTDPSLREPPIVCFFFENEVVGQKIFRSLKTQFGDVDESEEIRLSFIEGISEKNSRAYKVHFGTSRDVLAAKLRSYGLEPESTLLMMISRFHEMHPPSEPSSLAIFKHAYTYFKRYYITNAITEQGQLTPSWDNLIEKRKVEFRTKDEVMRDKNDEDSVVFSKKDGEHLL
jgi:hypothetical protein